MDAENLTFEENAIADRFRQLLVDTRNRADTATEGAVLHSIENSIITQGPALLRQAIEVETQHQIDLAQKKTKLPRM